MTNVPRTSAVSDSVTDYPGNLEAAIVTNSTNFYGENNILSIFRWATIDYHPLNKLAFMLVENTEMGKPHLYRTLLELIFVGGYTMDYTLETK